MLFGGMKRGVNGDESNNSAPSGGAVYVFNGGGATSNQQAYLKASNTDAIDLLGDDLALSGDGNTVAVGAWGEDSATTNVNGDQLDNTAGESGAV